MTCTLWRKVLAGDLKKIPSHLQAHYQDEKEPEMIAELVHIFVINCAVPDNRQINRLLAANYAGATKPWKAVVVPEQLGLEAHLVKIAIYCWQMKQVNFILEQFAITGFKIFKSTPKFFHP
jgi:hypothetical protein